MKNMHQHPYIRGGATMWSSVLIHQAQTSLIELILRWWGKGWGRPGKKNVNFLPSLEKMLFNKAGFPCICFAYISLSRIGNFPPNKLKKKKNPDEELVNLSIFPGLVLGSATEAIISLLICNEHDECSVQMSQPVSEILVVRLPRTTKTCAGQHKIML